jgi:hypothetical protein
LEKTKEHKAEVIAEEKKINTGRNACTVRK